MQSVHLLADGMVSFDEKCVQGIEPNIDVIEENVNRSLMLVTALNPHIGYEKAAEIAKLAFNEGTTLKEAAIKTGYLTEEQYDEWIDPRKMVNL